MQWATQQLVTIFVIVPWKICIFHVTMYWKPLSFVGWAGVLSWVKLKDTSETKAWPKTWASLASCWSSQVLHTTHWYPHISSSYGSFPSSVRCGVWFCEAPMLVWLYTHLMCPTKNLLQSAQFAGRRPLYFFLSPSSTHLASGDLLSQPARVIRLPNVANKTAVWKKWFTWSDLHIVISTCEKS